MFRSLVVASAFVVCCAGSAAAQAPPPAPAPPPPPPPGWAGSFGAGAALGRGNTDTTTFNLSFNLNRDTGSAMLFRSRGLYIREAADGAITSSRQDFEVRLDRRLSDRTSLYAAVNYLRDQFTEYIVTPTAGVARRLVKNDRTELGINAGLGVIWQKDLGVETTTSGALNLGQDLKHKFGKNAEVSEKVLVLLKLNDFGDAVYTFSAGLAAGVTSNTQIKIEVLDTFKTLPPLGAESKNDVSLLFSFVFKY
jgi:putative salt-induced outer membrane protein YdiY